jgi:hypothetical protein
MSTGSEGISAGIFKLDSRGNLIENFIPDFATPNCSIPFIDGNESRTLTFANGNLYWLHAPDANGDIIKKLDTDFNILQTYGKSNYASFIWRPETGLLPPTNIGQIEVDNTGNIIYKINPSFNAPGYMLTKISDDETPAIIFSHAAAYPFKSMLGLNEATYREETFSGGFAFGRELGLAGEILHPVLPDYDRWSLDGGLLGVDGLFGDWCLGPNINFCRFVCGSYYTHNLLPYILNLSNHDLIDSSQFQTPHYARSLCDINWADGERSYTQADTPEIQSVISTGSNWLLSFTPFPARLSPRPIINFCGEDLRDYTVDSHPGVMAIQGAGAATIALRSYESIGTGTGNMQISNLAFGKKNNLSIGIHNQNHVVYCFGPDSLNTEWTFKFQTPGNFPIATTTFAV